MRPDKTLNAGTAVVCGWLVMLMLSMLVIKLDPRIDAIGGETTVRLLQTAGLSKARAAEPARRAQCAARDLRLVTAIETHGEAQDVSGEVLSAAFSTVMQARAACDAGRIDEALAIYDGITVAPSGATRK